MHERRGAVSEQERSPVRVLSLDVGATEGLATARVDPPCSLRFDDSDEGRDPGAMLVRAQMAPRGERRQVE